MGLNEIADASCFDSLNNTINPQ